MLRILGNNRKLCNGLSRRDLIQAGAMGAAGLSLSQLLELQSVQAAEAPARGARSFGKAKNVLILFLYGSPGQLDTWDMKPNAPSDIRGPFKPIRSSNPSLDVCELLPKSAKWMHRVATVRSVTHDYPIHCVSYALTGMGQTDLAREVNVRDPRHWPYFGSVVDYLDAAEQRRAGRAESLVPRNIVLPHRFGRPGPQPHWLGSEWAPVVTSWAGKSTGADPYGQGRENPYGGISPDTRFQFSQQERGPELSVDRLNRRYTMLQQFDRGRAALEQSEEAHAWGRSQQLAMNLLTSARLREALDVQAEPAKVREAYGMTLFGQATLAGRRLIEAGSRVVTVFWDEYNLGNSAWDTHVFLVNRMRTELCPGFDMAFSALMKDLSERGLLEETLVCVLSEHGRTPKFNDGRDGQGPQGGGGRDHWAGAYCNLFAGAGIREGAVIGKTDATGGFPEERPVSPKDVLATIYHQLGIDPRTLILDQQQRPLPLVERGEVMCDLLV